MEFHKKKFIFKYIGLIQAINHLAKETYSVPSRRVEMEKISTLGFTKENVIEYCNIDYKIFTLFMQGNIALKSWIVYRDEGKLGPLCGFDIDLMYSRGLLDSSSMIAISE